jgi:hypothetical protein
MGVLHCYRCASRLPRAGPLLTADTHRIARSGAFTAFADRAHLDKTQRILVARTLALHSENDASIRVAAKGPEQLGTMHQQLLGDTAAHLRVQIPQSSWDAFNRSGLLPEQPLASASNGRNP